MISFRENYKLSYEKLSEKSGVSPGLIELVENGAVTHPLIVERFKELYSLTDIEAEELLPINRRPHDPKYDPDKYAFDDGTHFTVAKSKPKSEYAGYAYEHNSKKEGV